LDSYYFSRYPHIWGWATWRRSWQKYDFDLSTLELAKELRAIEQVCFPEINKHRFWIDRFVRVRETKHAWGASLTYASFTQSWLNILPSRNLVANIGFGAEGTHTLNPDSKFSRMSANEPDMPLRHPPFIVRNALADQRTDEKVFKINRPSRFRKMASKLISGTHRSRRG
jgi:hypothetical protein